MAGFGWLRNIQRAVASRAAGVVVGVVGITTAAIRANPMRDLIARADEAPKESVPEDQNSLEELAKEMENQDAAKLVKPPVSHDDFEGSFMSTNVDTFEGLRMAVQKQVNLNTAVSHFYWIGSSQIPPYYHYRLILQDQVNGAHCWVQTQDFANLNGNLGVKINESVEVTSDFGMNEKGNTYTATFNFKDIVNRTHVALQNGFDPSFAGAMFSAAFMQSVSKNLSFGGQSLYIAHQGVLVNSFGGMYDDGENCLSVQHGGTVSNAICVIAI
jgi:hypothetical protein